MSDLGRFNVEGHNKRGSGSFHDERAKSNAKIVAKRDAPVNKMWEGMAKAQKKKVMAGKMKKGRSSIMEMTHKLKRMMSEPATKESLERNKND